MEEGVSRAMTLQSDGRVGPGDPGLPQLLLRFSVITPVTPIDSYAIGFGVGEVEGYIEESIGQCQWQWCTISCSKVSDVVKVTTARLGKEEVQRYMKQENRPAAAAARRLL